MYTPAARSAALPCAFAFHRIRPALVSPPAFLGLDAFRKPPPLPLVPAALGTHGAVPVAASALKPQSTRDEGSTRSMASTVRT